MPYKSLAQQRYFNANKAKLEKQGINVAEWNKATGNKKLPERVGKTKKQRALAKLQRGLKGYKR